MLGLFEPPHRFLPPRLPSTRSRREARRSSAPTSVKSPIKSPGGRPLLGSCTRHDRSHHFGSLWSLRALLPLSLTSHSSSPTARDGNRVLDCDGAPAARSIPAPCLQKVRDVHAHGLWCQHANEHFADLSTHRLAPSQLRPPDTTAEAPDIRSRSVAQNRQAGPTVAAKGRLCSRHPERIMELRAWVRPTPRRRSFDDISSWN